MNIKIELLKRILKVVFLFLMVLASLTIVFLLRQAWLGMRQEAVSIGKKEAVLREMEREDQSYDQRIRPRLEKWRMEREKEIGRVESQIGSLTQEIEKVGSGWTDKMKELQDLEKLEKAALSAAKRAAIKRGALGEKVGWYQKSTYLVNSGSRRLVNSLEAAKQEEKLKIKAAETASAARLQVARIIKSSPVQSLREQKEAKERELSLAKENLHPEEAELIAGREERIRKTAGWKSIVDADKERVRNSVPQRILSTARSQLRPAVWIVLGVVLAPVLLKVVFFYGLAPLAGGLRPVCILPNAQAVCPSFRKSAVSLPFEIDDGWEILIHEDYLQTDNDHTCKQTQWFLNWRLPFSSIASGMILLTRVRPKDSNSKAKVVISSNMDPLAEIGAIRLPETCSIVIQPRAMAGIVKQRSDQVHITRHWRLLSLHAWLTLQLRYLVLHGPCELILKGCRGVRFEEITETNPVNIDQAATIGFSANLLYKNTRCETFLAYFRGKKGLFRDKVAGGVGCFVYEELPDKRKGGLMGRGMEGLLDAALKVFGI